MKITETASSIDIKTNSDANVLTADNTGYSISFSELAKILIEIDSRIKILESK